MLAIAEEGRGVFAFAIDTKNRRLFFETAKVVGTACMSNMMLNRVKLNLMPINIDCLE